MRIGLTRGKTVLIDDCDAELVSVYRWYADVSKSGKFRARTNIHGPGKSVRAVLMHRLISGAPIYLHVDHINGDTLDNRRCNLRTCHPSQNSKNRLKQSGSSSYKGVTWSRREGYWKAQIAVDGRRIGLGSYSNELDAASKYDAAARFYHKEFASLNFPSHGETSCFGEVAK